MVVTIAERIHLFPSRTQKLSSLTPKVLGLDPGRIGSCHLQIWKSTSNEVLFLLLFTRQNFVRACFCFDDTFAPGARAPTLPRAPLDKAVLFGYTVREQYEPAFGGIFCAPCRSSSLQYGGIAASSSRQGISKSTRQKCEAIKSCGFAPRQGKGRRPCRAHGQGP